MTGEFTGLFAGTVVDNDDPIHKCRIRVAVPEVLDSSSGWCVPALPFAGEGCGFAVVPPLGASVWVQWPRGDLSAPPVWSGSSWSGSAAVDGAGPNTVIVQTPNGHRLVLDDDTSSVTVQASGGATVTLDANGITLDNGQGATVSMQSNQVNVNNGALVVM